MDEFREVTKMIMSEIDKDINVPNKNDSISRQVAIDAVHEEFDECTVWDESGEYTADVVERILDDVPAAQPEVRPIDYQDCSNAMLKMWMDNVVTDGEYNRIMDKLNAHWGKKNG